MITLGEPVIDFNPNIFCAGDPFQLGAFDLNDWRQIRTVKALRTNDCHEFIFCSI